MACVAYGELNGLQEINVRLFCDFWFRVVYLRSFVHAQSGRTPLLEAARNGHVEIAQLLMEKGANIEIVDKVSFLTLSNWQGGDFASESIVPHLTLFLWYNLKAWQCKCDPIWLNMLVCELYDKWFRLEWHDGLDWWNTLHLIISLNGWK